MRRPPSFLVSSSIIVATVTASVTANEPARKMPPAVQAAVAELQAEHPAARLHTQAGRITRIYGQPLAVGRSAEDSANHFRNQHAAVFGVDPQDLRAGGVRSVHMASQPVMYQPETDDYKFTLVRFSHQKDGIPVFRSELRLLVRNLPNAPVVLASSSLRPLGGFRPDLAAAGRDFDPADVLPQMERFSEPETVIWAGVDRAVQNPKLARVFIAGRGSMQNGDFEEWLYVVDGTTGAVLHRENRIIMTDVAGNVSGIATQGPKADFCSTIAQTTMPWALASISGGSSAYADLNGDFTIANADTTDVSVESPMMGRYFVVSDFAATVETLTQTVTPPGPADFVHNAADADEFVRAQVNAYVEANDVRDFALSYNPSFPVISTQVDFPVRVNRSDQFCPGNAWYDFASINFCRSGSGFPNTGFSVVVHHEYGHHMVESAGSGQGPYGEGFGDVMGVLIEDDPILAYGWEGDCNAGLRSADNTLQYPCSGEIHFCGQLLSGCVWSTRNELIATNPSTYHDILSNIAVNSVLLHTGSDITPAITIDFLVLDDDDGDLGNGSPHWTEICAGFGAHNMDCPEMIGCSVPSDCPDDDGLFCNGPDCRNGLCFYVNDPCDDGKLCTQNVCDETTDTCSNPPLVCPPPADGCDSSVCDPQIGCVIITDAHDCDDGLFCNGMEGCSDGECLPGIPPCSAECCDEEIDRCRGCDNDGVCDFNEDCNCCPGDCIGGGAECGNGVCQTADGEDCLTCPTDCNGVTGGKPADRFCCGDGSAPDGVTCADPRCTAGGNTCSTSPGGAFCCGDRICEDIEDVDNCASDCDPLCLVDEDCDDGDLCTTDRCDPLFGCFYQASLCNDFDNCTSDFCVDGVCQHEPLICDDGNACTVDSCDQVLGCVFDPIPCDDGDACTLDTCSNGVCSHGPLVCDDDDECTTDTCSSSTGCVFTPIPGCSSCLPRHDPCSFDSDCCSNKCRGGSCK